MAVAESAIADQYMHQRHILNEESQGHIAGVNAMSHSYRNVGDMQNGIYDKVRNSYQNGTQYDMMNQSSFHTQKSPKVQGMKQIKINGNQGHQKNVRIMLVGNNGMKN